MDRIVVVGAAAAGLTAAETLRREGFEKQITLVGDELHLPYDRPPLSKQVLSGAWETDRIALRKDSVYTESDIGVRLGVRATGLDTSSQVVQLASGDSLHYDGLIIATGVRPRLLPFGHDLTGVYVMRTLDDAVSLKKALASSSRLVVVGAGFLGCEAAASARRLGLDVTLVDPLPQPMVRQFGPMIGGLVSSLHTAEGVSVRTGVGVSSFQGSSHVTGVVLSDGTVLDADVVLVAIGAEPATDWLSGSGLVLDNGIVCDAYCRAAPGVYAAGDVASWHHQGYAEQMRVEHRMNATEQGMAAARNLLGASVPFCPIPYFWTDQYDTKIAAFGLLTGDVTVTEGTPESGKFMAHYTREGKLVGVLSWNMPRELRKARALLMQTG
ncbi:NADPH-dependent 2,4-dienoyl-CoA reductase/sulfur reductase-like enzyme [Kibdelosporangium banguiense]|uniref:NADPH-dependent 2,4-dienoyl-CoA reductase/sulfur reductase-like enzyme n=1 Tax=Kibdelosporangium banguiense TaxID=1365924 RepID=A0ABS4U1B9_9PSEU|nr:FAD-dependent oxidoreductase [Kibdelosporangium banguiense]MBP2330024.1 NADPH-dependent 2,4-dienoyl-CoA reductase/sulfur reductase-like enzyme [Kibdelosporangium banguiense]